MNRHKPLPGSTPGARPNSRPVALYVYRGAERDSGVPWQDERCGTYAGWNAHRYVGEQACDRCKRAHADYMRDYRLRKGITKTIRIRPSAAQLALLRGAR